MLNNFSEKNLDLTLTVKLRKLSDCVQKARALEHVDAIQHCSLLELVHRSAAQRSLRPNVKAERAVDQCWSSLRSFCVRREEFGE